MRNELKPPALVAALLLMAGCARDVPQALGTLEWDRVTLPSPVAEKIMRIDVREGQQVAAGAPLLQLELTRTQSQLAAAQALATESREALAELRAGPRVEDIAQARASLSAAQAQARGQEAREVAQSRRALGLVAGSALGRDQRGERLDPARELAPERGRVERGTGQTWLLSRPFYYCRAPRWTRPRPVPISCSWVAATPTCRCCAAG